MQKIVTPGYTEREAAFFVHGERRLQHGTRDRKTLTVLVFAFFIGFYICGFFFQYKARSQLCYRTLFIFQMLDFINSYDLQKETFKNSKKHVNAIPVYKEKKGCLHCFKASTRVKIHSIYCIAFHPS